ncbi:UTP--glucose-1-phosphate uridylyltransferase [Candidatus Magnetomoraceae bacterium gMMP-15]
MKNNFLLFKEKMEKQKLPATVIDTFQYYYEKLVAGETGILSENDILPVETNEIPDVEKLECNAAGRAALKKTAFIKLNGGLGTSMGMPGPKSLLEVKKGLSFLDIILKQSESEKGIKIPLVLMNSFSTHKPTLDALSKALSPDKVPLSFIQHKFPKVLKKNLSPAVWDKNPELEWNPPGHGDIYIALITSGMLPKLLDMGIIYAFISNSDNLGAVIDKNILGYFAENNFPFMMEVTDRSQSDKKGGHLAKLRKGGLILREIAQCPENEIKSFQDINRYKYFNTNNIWINLIFLKEILKKEKILQLPMIRNPKKLDPTDDSSPDVFQIETAMGSAISLFKGASAVRVKRDRYIPVKKCNDLLAVWSDCYKYTPEHRIVLNPQRKFGPIIDLDSKYYSKINQFRERFPCAPSLLECNSLIIKGDVRFEKNVVIKGDVIIENRSDKQFVIKQRTVINKNLITEG